MKNRAFDRNFNILSPRTGLLNLQNSKIVTFAQVFSTHGSLKGPSGVGGIAPMMGAVPMNGMMGMMQPGQMYIPGMPHPGLQVPVAHNPMFPSQMDIMQEQHRLLQQLSGSAPRIPQNFAQRVPQPAQQVPQQFPQPVQHAVQPVQHSAPMAVQQPVVQ